MVVLVVETAAKNMIPSFQPIEDYLSDLLLTRHLDFLLLTMHEISNRAVTHQHIEAEIITMPHHPHKLIVVI